MTPEYQFSTLAAEHRHAIDPIKGSRFLTTAAPTRSVEEGQAVLDRVRGEFPNASHHCWAWRLGVGGHVTRSSDDGEPAGSAGRPILAQIEGHGLVDVTLVVSRWFGGTKLGVGGLVRAYGGAAGKTLDRAPIATVIVTRRVVLEFPYDCSGPLQGLLAASALEPVEAQYGASVRLVLDVPERELDEFASEARERSAGRAELRDA